MRVLIIDDNLSDIDDLKDRLNQINQQIDVECCQNPFEGINIIKQWKFEVIFLDIEMPGLSGVDIARTQINDGTPIVIVSSFPEYAVECTQFRPFDYLLKPVSLKKLRYALQRIEDYLNKVEDNVQLQFQTGKSKYVYCDVDDILYFEAYGDYQKLFTCDERHVITDTMKELSNKMDPHHFIRIHRSFLINRKHIKQVFPKHVVIEDSELPIGWTYRNNLRNLLG